ncbi:MAG: hypothetical protein ACREL5_14190 [Gemmatimonadales bacterium]
MLLDRYLANAAGVNIARAPLLGSAPITPIANINAREGTDNNAG